MNQSVRWTACSMILLGASAATHAERRGVADWIHDEQFGSYACLHCKLAAMRAAEHEAADGVRFEPGTGRDLRNYAPDRPADLLHMRLKLDIPDMNTPKLSGEQTLKLTPVGRPLDVLTLNAQQMMIDSVSLSGDTRVAANTKIEHSYDGAKLSIRFDPPVPLGAEADLAISYRLDSPADGLFWTPETPAWPGRPAQIHTQGQPETNRYWFPTHDFPNERLTTEIITTVPEGFLVSSNGREAAPPRTENGRTTFHWLQEKSHVSYLVSLIVGKFDVQDVAPAGSTLSMPVWVPPGKGELIQQTYGRTAEMVKVFEKLFDEPYPWSRYAQICVWNFGAGGMENTSATTMYDTAILDSKALEDDDLDGLISHELAHQWFGDLITCNTWAHIWLNEGWATYSTSLWFEARDGEQNGYVNAMHRTMRGIARNDQLAADASPEARRRPGMVSTIYKHPWETFRRVSNPYPKGSSILHMLRRELGDELFFGGVAAYVDGFKYGTAETHDFRRMLEETSGRSLEQFFWQWCERPGTPKVMAKASWSEKDKQLKLVIEQKQFIDSDHPAFAFDLPIEVYTKGPSAGDVSQAAATLVMKIDANRHEQTLALDAEPAMVLIDPDLHVLMDIEVEAPSTWLIEQMKTSRSIASRLDAMHFVRGKNSATVRTALVDAVKNTGEFWSVRARAAESLGKMSATAELLALLEGGIEHARVRLAAIRALGEIGGEAVLPALARHASDANESYACRAAALESLGKHAPRGSDTYLPVFTSALASESQHDQVRLGAVRGLAALDHKESMGMVVPFTKLGTLNRVRPDAIDAVAKLAKHDKDRAFELVSSLVQDSEERAKRAAIDALAELKDRRGLDVLERMIATTSHAPTQERAKTARDRLAAALTRGESIDATQAEVERLKADLKRLEKQIDEK